MIIDYVGPNESLRSFMYSYVLHVQLTTGCRTFTNRAQTAVRNRIEQHRKTARVEYVDFSIVPEGKLKHIRSLLQVDYFTVVGADRLKTAEIGNARSVQLHGVKVLESFVSLNEKLVDLDIDSRYWGSGPTWQEISAGPKLQFTGIQHTFDFFGLSHVRVADNFAVPTQMTTLDLDKVANLDTLDLAIRRCTWSLRVTDCHDLLLVNAAECPVVTLVGNARLRHFWHTCRANILNWKIQDNYCLPGSERPSLYWRVRLKQLCVVQRYVKTRRLRKFIKLVTSKEFNEFIFMPDQMGGRLAKKDLLRSTAVQLV